MILFSFLYGFLKTNCLNRIGKNISRRRGGGGMFDNVNGNWCMLGSAFFVSSRAFLCRTMYFLWNRAFLCQTRPSVSNECYDVYITYPKAHLHKMGMNCMVRIFRIDLSDMMYEFHDASLFTEAFYKRPTTVSAKNLNIELCSRKLDKCCIHFLSRHTCMHIHVQVGMRFVMCLGNRWNYLSFCWLSCGKEGHPIDSGSLMQIQFGSSLVKLSQGVT